MMTDPIADMLTRIRNAQKVGKTEVVLSLSKMKRSIADILKREGYVSQVEILDEKPAVLRIVLKYDENKAPAIQSIKRISTVGRRVYAPKNELPKVLQGYGMAVVSTSKGLLTAREAIKAGVGGEIICEVY